MKNMKKIVALLIAMIMVLGMGTTAFAQEVDSEKGGPASITITLPTQETAPTATTTYKIYKVFNATSDGTTDAIAYSLVDGKTTAPAGFTVDAAGNVKYTGSSTSSALTDADIAAIAGYVTDSDLVYTASVPTGEKTVKVTGLEYGYYYITTSTGSVVTVDSTNPNAAVNDKNVIPPVHKSAGTEYDADSLKAIAAVGTNQPFTAQITKTHGATNLVFEDTMTNMTYNGDVAITVSEGTAPTAAQAVVTTTSTGFKVTFDNAYIAGLKDDTVITLKYSGKITSDALSQNPALNKATLTSGEGNVSTSEEVEVYNAKFTVTKQDGKEKPLAGAGFVIKNSEGAYYCLASDGKSITWYTLGTDEKLADAIAAGKVSEYKSDSTGAVKAFTGLGDGKYTLVESTTPAGYNTAPDYEFTIKGADYTTTNLEQSTTVINESGTELPSTGGIGTTLFYVVGSILVIGAAVLLISKRRMSNR